MNIGLDFHGVVESSPEFFQVITDLLLKNGHEVHIITGMTMADFLKREECEGISFTHFFSITDSLLEQKGVPTMLDKFGRHTFPSTYWDNAKARYCEANGIDLMIDDTEKYSLSFTTPFIQWERKK